MPAGCEFFCDNKECSYFRTGFTIRGAWPLGNISLVINSSSVRQNKNFQEHLIELKDSGRKHACITLPNVDAISVEGFRFNFWCEGCSCVWDKDVFFTEEEQSEWEDKNLVPEEWFDNVTFDYVCSKCKGKLKSFDTVIEDGLSCPSCKEALGQSRWFSNFLEGNSDAKQQKKREQKKREERED